MVNFLAHHFDRLGDYNPQLYREIKSRLTPQKARWLLLASGICQGLIIFFLQGGLPVADPQQTNQFSRYCLGSLPEWEYNKGAFVCTSDLLGKLVINWRLWWLDGFTFLSMAGLALLLVVGFYLVVADLQKENQQGTLNFVRLSPQSENTFVWGKLGGVPCLLYGFLLTLLPLHLAMALGAGISPGLLLGYYGVVAAGAAFFFHLAIWIGLSGNGKQASISQSAAIAGLLAIAVLIVTFSTLIDDSWEPFFFSWLTLFYPGKALIYLVQSTFLPLDLVGYLGPNELENLRWYGAKLFGFAPLGMGFMVFNFSLATYWCQRVLQRRFRRPQSTAWSKRESLGVTFSLAAIANGFIFQTYASHNKDYLFLNLSSWQLVFCLYFLGLTLALVPQTTYLRDWSRYRHEAPRPYRSWSWQALGAEHSPAQGAIAINLALVALLTIPFVVLVSLLFEQGPIRLGAMVVGIIVGLLWNFTFSSLGQWAMASLRLPRLFLVVVSVVLIIFLPLAIAIGLGSEEAIVMWFSPLSVLAVLEKGNTSSVFFLLMALASQTVAIGLSSWQFNRYLRRLGRSETQLYLESDQKAKALGH